MMSTLTILGGAIAGGPLAVVAKATAVLVAATCTAILLRHASAAVRHVVWLVALAGCTALVMVAPIAPTIAVPVVTQAAVGRQIPPARALARAREQARRRLQIQGEPR